MHRPDPSLPSSDYFFEEIDSTQDYLKTLLRSDAPPRLMTWARAARQTKGRGRQGRTWLNSEGALLTSVAFRLEPADGGEKPFVPFVSILAFTALYRALIQLRPQLQPHLFFKWPNDLITFDEGGRALKIAGILSEGFQSNHLIVGWGVNVMQVPTEGDDGLRVLCQSVEGLLPGEDAVALNLLPMLYLNLQQEFQSLILSWQTNPHQLQRAVVEELKPVLSRFLGRHGVVAATGQQVEAHHLDDNGLLWVRDLASQKLERLHSGEFNFLENS